MAQIGKAPCVIANGDTLTDQLVNEEVVNPFRRARGRPKEAAHVFPSALRKQVPFESCLPRVREGLISVEGGPDLRTYIHAVGEAPSIQPGRRAFLFQSKDTVGNQVGQAP